MGVADPTVDSNADSNSQSLYVNDDGEKTVAMFKTTQGLIRLLDGWLE